MPPEPDLILLVEDDPAHAEIVRRIMAELQLAHILVHATDGHEALDYLFKQGLFEPPVVSPRPTLILLDVRLPKVSALMC